MKQKKLFTPFILVLLISLISVFSWMVLASTTTQSKDNVLEVLTPLPGVNTSSNLLFNLTADIFNASGAGNYTNITIQFFNASENSGKMVYNFTITDDENVSVSNITYNTTIVIGVTTNLTDGIYNITFNVTNASDDAELNNSSFMLFPSDFLTIDTENPRDIAFTNPATDANLSASTFTALTDESNFNFTANNTSGSALHTVILMFTNGTSAFNKTIMNETNRQAAQHANFSYTGLLSGDLIPGYHNVTAWVNDTAGNVNRSVNLQVYADDVGPNVTINSPTANSFTNDNTTLVNFTITDDTGVNESSINVSLNTILTGTSRNDTYTGNSSDNVVSCSGATTSLTCTMTLNVTNESEWTLNVTAWDVLGNANNNDSNLFTIDLTSPTRESFSINDTYLGNATLINVSVNASDGGLANSTVASVNLSVDGGTTWTALDKNTSNAKASQFDAQLTLSNLAAGINTLQVRVYDNASNYVENNHTVTLDVTNSSFTLVSPTNGATLNSTGNVTFEFNVTENNASLVSFTVDGILQAQTNTTNGSQVFYVDSKAGLEGGLHKWNVTVTDQADNSITSALWSFTLQAPINVSRRTARFITDLHPGNVTNVTYYNASGGNKLSGGSVSLNFTVRKQFVINKTTAEGQGVLVNVTAHGYNFDENKSDRVVVVVNRTMSTLDNTAANSLLGSSVAALSRFVLFQNFDQYLNSSSVTNSSGSAQWITIDFNQTNLTNDLNVVYITDDNGNQVRKIGNCASNTVPTTTPSEANACYVNVSGGSFVAYVPHLSGIGLVNVSSAPVINFTVPAESTTLPQVTNSFLAQINGTVLDLNFANCSYNLTNNTNGQLVANQSLSTTENTGSNQSNYTWRGTTGLAYLKHNASYNLTVECFSSDGNVSSRTRTLEVNDALRPNITSVSSGSPGEDSATVSWSTNEYANASVEYGTANGTLGTFRNTAKIGTSHSIDLNGLTSETAYYYNVTSCDGANNCNTSGTNSFTTAAAASAASSSGGGGGGTVLGTTKTGTKSTSKWLVVAAGSVANMRVKNEGISVSDLKVKMKNRVQNVEISVEKLSEAPTEGSSIIGKAYEYVEFTKSGVTEEDIESAEVKFGVAQAWLTENSIDQTGVVLIRLVDGKWTDLPTKVLRVEGKKVLYEATTPGFSTFAIVGRTKVQAKEAEVAASTPAVEEPEPEAPAEATTEDKAPLVPTTPPKGGVSGWLILIIIVVVGGVGYFVYQKKQGA